MTKRTITRKDKLVAARRAREAAQPGKIPGNAQGNLSKAKKAAAAYLSASDKVSSNSISMQRVLAGTVDKSLLDKLWAAGRDADIAGHNAVSAMSQYEKLFRQIQAEVR